MCDGCGRGSNEFASRVQNYRVPKIIGCRVQNYRLRFLLSVCLCVTDVGVAVTNLRVVCKIIACRVQNYRVRSSCHRIFSRCKSCCCMVRTLRVAGYAKDAIVDACHRTNDGQEHKIIWRAGPEQDFLLTCHSVQRARQPLSRRTISLGSFTGAVDFVLQLIRLESLGSELQQSYITTFILWLITLAMH